MRHSNYPKYFLIVPCFVGQFIASLKSNMFKQVQIYVIKTMYQINEDYIRGILIIHNALKDSIIMFFD